jgi:hypothetical protein
MYGAMPRSDSAARNEQAKAALSDTDGNDAKRRSTSAIETRHTCRTLRTRRGPVFSRGGSGFAAFDVEKFEQR